MGLPIINLNLIPTFPSRVFGSGPIVITKAGLNYTFSWDVSTYSLNPAPSASAQVLSYDPSTGATELIEVGSVAADWDNIVNKPATFPPSAHTHPISQIDNLQSELDAKLDDTQAGTFGLTLLGAASASAARTSLALVPGTDVQAYDADLAAIAALSGTNNIYYRSGANTWSSVTIGSNLTFSGGTLSGASATTPNGSVINSVYAEYTANADLSTVLPYDDTIPQSTEGTQVLSASITPGSTTNKLRIRYMLWGSNSGGSAVMSAAVFLGGSSAVQASAVTINGGSGVVSPLCGEYEYTPGSTSSVTVTVRVGASTGSLRLNGGGARIFGGASRCTLVVEEIKA